jgi:EmrB/QacA subfamily drug resistance transporter
MTATGAVPARVVPTRRVSSPNRVLIVASLGAVLAFIDATIVNVAFPDIRRSFSGADFASVSWVLNAYNIVFAAFLVAAGRIADLLGRKRLFEWGVIVFTAASLLCAIAPTLGLLVAFRVIQALGAAIVVPTSLALVMNSFTGERRAHGVALWSAIAAASAGIGPSLGGLLVAASSWRLVFLVNIPIGIATVLLSRRALVESRAPGRRTIPDLAGALLLAAATASLTVGIIKGSEWGWGSPRVVGAFAAAVVLGAMFVYRCTWHRSPMLDLGLLRIRSLAVANLLTLVGAAGFYAYVLCNVLFLTTVWHYSVLQAGLAITPGPFVAAAIAGPAGKLADRIGARWVLFGGGLIWAAGVEMLVQRVGLQPHFLSEWLPTMVVLGLGAGVTFPVVGAVAVASVSGGRFATATGLNSIARQLGAVLGVSLLVAIIGTPSPADVADAFDRGWAFAAFCFVAVASGSLLLGPVARAEPDGGAELEAGRAPGTEPPSAKPAAPAVGAERAIAAPSGPRTPQDVLRAVPLFAELGDEALDELASHAGTIRVQAGETLFSRGDAADALYVVVSGRLEVLLEDASPEVLRVMGPGAVVGELALLADTPRSASIRARRDSELLQLRREDFDRLMGSDTGFTAELVRQMGLQLQRSRMLESPGPAPASTVAVVAAGDNQRFEAICDALVDGLACCGHTIRVDAPVDEDFAGQAQLLERYESEFDQIVLVAPRLDAWGRFCVRQADRTALVTGGDMTSAGHERELRRCDLLFPVGDAGAPAPARWIDSLEPRALHPIESGERFEASVRRVARRLAGRSVGVVLSGGGARGLAHIGVLAELLAAGVVIDRVGGCDTGAFIGAMVAMGMEPDEIDARCYEEWVRRSPLSDYRIPRTSLIRGERVRALLERNLPGSIEELPLEFFCVSGDLGSGGLVVHRRGSLSRAVLASMSIPGLIAPTIMDGRLLVDGAMLNNLPVDVMAARNEGPVVAVDVNGHDPAQSSGSGNGEVPARPRRWRPGRSAPSDEQLPALGETLLRGLMLGSAGPVEAARRQADLLITPSSEGAGLFEYHQLDVLKASGRRAAAAALERAPASLFSAFGSRA